MNKIKVLVQGYARMINDEKMEASGTTTLIESNKKKVLVDPGADEKRLKKAFEKENLKIEDVDIVFLTHFHPDHFLNIRLFPNHKIYDADTIYTNEIEEFYEGNIPGTEIEVIQTPGHTPEHVTLIVEVDNQIYAIAQDLFWWLDGEQKCDTKKELIYLVDNYAFSNRLLKESRERILKIADYIIPGHGKIFKNPCK